MKRARRRLCSFAMAACAIPAALIVILAMWPGRDEFVPGDEWVIMEAGTRARAIATIGRAPDREIPDLSAPQDFKLMIWLDHGGEPGKQLRARTNARGEVWGVQLRGYGSRRDSALNDLIYVVRRWIRDRELARGSTELPESAKRSHRGLP